ncbi:MAG: hypothetical protein IKQ32_00830 [Prevotella sp.]|nr:hypothetical protein [Prevotella sp.]
MHLQTLKHIVLLWLMLYVGTATAFSVNYRNVFGSDWTEAECYVREHHEEWKKEFDLFNVDSRVADAIVFPELIRYSMWKDEIEKVAVNGLYVTKGKEGANFSVGRFQMKPSFAEDVERAWNSSPLAQKYGFSFNLADNNEARRSRVRRLSTEEGQCRYLAIFIRLQQIRHPKLLQLSQQEQIGFLATSYNCSFDASWDAINRMRHERHFHTDVVKTRKTHFYCYADIAIAYYLTKTSSLSAQSNVHMNRNTKKSLRKFLS